MDLNVLIGKNKFIPTPLRTYGAWWRLHARRG